MGGEFELYFKATSKMGSSVNFFILYLLRLTSICYHFDTDN